MVKHLCLTGLFLTLIFGTTACSLFAQKRAPSSTAQNTNSVGAGSVSIRDFNQLLDSVTAVTGVSRMDPVLVDYYNSARTRLSTDGNSNSVTSPVLLTMTSIAGVACKRMIEMEQGMTSSSRAVYNSVNFVQDQTVLTPSVRLEIFNKLAAKFWRRTLTASEALVLSQSIDDALAGEVNSSNNLIVALLVNCTSMLSSLDFIQS